ncbi:MAG TPA: protein tyrosine phosphatase family protein [Burkholderiaceae bacterium]|jgi:protein tyrosine phosphatase (PTP) superfamily phosphohydrolase (DUF442 family)|nr:protein tyrosine phosphatase family protein [Burkholderiaceae bacterium]
MHIAKTIRSAVTLMLALAILNLNCTAFAAATGIDAPNVVPISATLVTSGQPTADAIAHLAEQGFAADIYLAPLTVPDAVPGEADSVRKQGMEFVNIPIKFGTPTEADFQAFVDAMNKFQDRKVLVHCQVNMRASSMTFLYRVIVGHEDPEKAYESVARVWSPHGPWKELIVSQLHKAGIKFEPY